jgi:hypothetical protein
MITKYLKRYLLLIVIFLPYPIVQAQDIDQLLEEANNSSTDYTSATFKSTRIMNGHSIERMPAGQLDVRISHRFGQLNSGAYNLWGLDEANTHLGVDYGITNWMMVGVGRASTNKTYDGFFKFSILRQCKGKKNMPISLSYFTSMAIQTLKNDNPGPLNFWDRVSYVHQILVARKFNERFSFELNPTFIHENMVETALDPNDIWSLGGGGRFKLTKRISLNGEYYYVIPPKNDNRSYVSYNQLALGIDIETGGHVFQFIFSNSRYMIEKDFIGHTTSQWKNGGIYFGFNISRVFSLTKQN